MVCGRLETIDTFEPTSRFTSVDFPTLGRPTRLTNPERCSVTTCRAPCAPVRPGARSSFGTRPSGGLGDRHDRHRRDAAALDPFGAELEALEPHRLARLGHVAEQVEDEPADGVPLRVGELDAQHLVHLVDRRAARRADAAARGAARRRAPRCRTRRRSRRRSPRAGPRASRARPCRRTRRRRSPCGTSACASRAGARRRASTRARTPLRAPRRAPGRRHRRSAIGARGPSGTRSR